jgi:cyclic pyranopterin phosphate synthase
VLKDTLGRPLANLRLSVTDRCNLRCQYCMPLQDYTWLPREELLTFEEIGALVEVFTRLGVSRIRLTGGEPLLRRDLPTLIGMLAGNSGVKDLALTTNGTLLSEQAASLRAAGLRRITISLDTLQPERFRALVKQDMHADVLRGIRAAQDAGFHGTKIDAVVIRGFNDDEVGDLIKFGREQNAEVRFIEYMDVGGATDWSAEKVFSRAQILLSGKSLRENRTAQRRFQRAGGTVSFGRWNGIWSYRFDDRAILPQVRSQPFDGRWPLVFVFVRAAGN